MQLTYTIELCIIWILDLPPQFFMLGFVTLVALSYFDSNLGPGLGSVAPTIQGMSFLCTHSSSLSLENRVGRRVIAWFEK